MADMDRIEKLLITINTNLDIALEKIEKIEEHLELEDDFQLFEEESTFVVNEKMEWPKEALDRLLSDIFSDKVATEEEKDVSGDNVLAFPKR